MYRAPTEPSIYWVNSIIAPRREGAGNKMGEESRSYGGAEALATLLAGNARYAEGRQRHTRVTEAARLAAVAGQRPYALVFGCVDSRVPAELIFDCGLGALLVVRTAGHVLDRAALGSIEFGVGVLGVPLALVLGHTRCGAVQAALDAAATGEMPPDAIAALVEGIRPAVERTAAEDGDRVTATVEANTLETVARLRATPLLAEAERSGRLTIAGAIYDLASGRVRLVEQK